MKFDQKNPPRRFSVGNARKFDMSDCGTMHLAPDEQITFVTENGGEYDLARKDWGFYATPSLNGRLETFGLRTVLIQNRGTKRYFILLVERGKEAAFDDYLRVENLRIVHWLDSTDSCAALDNLVSAR
jgi:hypothetical protein